MDAQQLKLEVGFLKDACEQVLNLHLEEFQEQTIGEFNDDSSSELL